MMCEVQRIVYEIRLVDLACSKMSSQVPWKATKGTFSRYWRAISATPLKAWVGRRKESLTKCSIFLVLQVFKKEGNTSAHPSMWGRVQKTVLTPSKAVS